MKICIVDYGMGNIKSVLNALNFIGKKADLISDPKNLSSYDIIILPGVGAFKEAMKILKNKKLDIQIKKAAREKKKIIGICLGMQLLFSKSKEFGDSKGLNLIEGDVLPFDKKINLRIPHMGWNNVVSNNNLYSRFEGDYYFVHSFYCKPKNDSEILFKSNYGIEFCSAILKDDNIFGFQFHPEKSQSKGIELLKNILSKC